MIKHRKSNTKLYKVYHHIKDRCYNKNDKRYKDYGERGIYMCSEWLDDFMNFYNWSMNNGYNDNLTIDRIDNNKGYSPNNCRWVDRKTQQQNRRNCIYYTINGETHCLKEWCEILNLNYSTVQVRVYRGWDVKKALEVE